MNDVDFLVGGARAPGGLGVKSALELIGLLPPIHHGDAMKLVWTDPPKNRAAWACMFAVAWRTGSHRVERAAGSRPQLLRWIAAADYDAWLPPLMRDLCGHRAELPPRLRLYRGGAGKPDVVADGLSWSTMPSEAAWYAQRHARRTGLAPVVLARSAPREAVLWCWRLDGGELLLPPGPWRLHTADADRIASLARVGDRRNTALVDQWATMAANHLARPGFRASLEPP